MGEVIYVVNSELYHHGVLGQKWGRRRYQNEDGSYKTGAEGRYYDEVKDRKGLKKFFKKKSSADVEEAVKKEKQLNELERMRAQNAKYRADTERIINSSKNDTVSDVINGKSEEKKKGMSFAKKLIIGGALVAGGVIVYKKFGGSEKLSGAKEALKGSAKSAAETVKDSVKESVSNDIDKTVKEARSTAKDILKNIKKDEKSYNKADRAAEKEYRKMDRAAEKEVNSMFRDINKASKAKEKEMTKSVHKDVKDILNNLKKDNFFNQTVEKVSGTVEGTGKSYWESTASKKYSSTPVKDIIDVEWREVWSDNRDFNYPAVIR